MQFVVTYSLSQKGCSLSPYSSVFRSLYVYHPSDIPFDKRTGRERTSLVCQRRQDLIPRQSLLELKPSFVTQNLSLNFKVFYNRLRELGAKTWAHTSFSCQEFSERVLLCLSFVMGTVPHTKEIGRFA